MSGTPDWRGYAEELDALDAELDKLQEAKRDIFKAVRQLHGAVTADGLKKAMKIRRSDPDKLTRAEEVDGMAAEILAAINAPRAPRATRARTWAIPPGPVVDEPFNPETGGLEPEDRATDAVEGSLSPVAAAEVVATAPAEPAADKGSATTQTEGDRDAKYDRAASDIDPDLIVGRRQQQPERNGRDTIVPKPNGVTSQGGENPADHSPPQVQPTAPYGINPHTGKPNMPPIDERLRRRA